MCIWSRRQERERSGGNREIFIRRRRQHKQQRRSCDNKGKEEGGVDSERGMEKRRIKREGSLDGK